MQASTNVAQKKLDGITERQRAVMDLVIQHRTSKEIARELGIAPNTVDQRINAVRDKLGAQDRAETARLYQAILELCGKTTYGSPVVDSFASQRLSEAQEAEIDPVFMLNDNAVSTAAEWSKIGHFDIPGARVSESKLWRFAAIIMIAGGTLIILTAILAIMNALNALL